MHEYKPIRPYADTKWRISDYSICYSAMIISDIVILLSAVDCHRISNKQELGRAVATIGDWETLYENLGTPEPVLKQLRFDSIATEVKRSRCLEAYLNTDKACWETVVKVVADYPFYNKKLARKIANEHGVDYSSIVKEEL